MSRFIRDEVMAAIIAKAGLGTCDDGTPIRRAPTIPPSPSAAANSSTVSTTGTVHIGVVNVYYGVKAPGTPE
jgi:hypothetical protein